MAAKPHKPDGIVTKLRQVKYLPVLRKCHLDLTQKLQGVLARIPFPGHLPSAFLSWFKQWPVPGGVTDDDVLRIMGQS